MRRTSPQTYQRCLRRSASDTVDTNIRFKKNLFKLIAKYISYTTLATTIVTRVRILIALTYVVDRNVEADNF